jgi:signal transduction histidine kinase
VSWLFGCSGWVVVVLLVWVLCSRRSLVADAEHELRGAVTAIGLAAGRMRRPGATRASASLVDLQLNRMEAALVDLGAARELRLWRRAPAVASTGRPTAPIDAGRLSQVVANLLDNAAEHGTGPVTVRWTATDAGSRLEVRNANTVVARSAGAGRGRGLGIATRAAHELGGSLRVDSSDEATAATLDLPATPERRRSRAA